MRVRTLVVAAVAVTLSACASGGPATLGYAVPSMPEVRYSYGDTTLVTASMMGQSMEVSMRGSADYAVVFAPATGGVRVALSVENISGSVEQPLGAPIQIGGAAVDGELVFDLDRRGNASVVSTPEVAVEASQMVSSLATAHGFFPGLPDRAVAAGDMWVDTVSYEGEDVTGPRSEESIVTYTVVGETTVDGRSLLNITFTGTTELRNAMNMGGMQIGQQSTLEIEGHVLWDRQAGVMYELRRTGSGEGSVSVPIAPAPLPIRISLTQRARLQGT